MSKDAYEAHIATCILAHVFRIFVMCTYIQTGCMDYGFSAIAAHFKYLTINYARVPLLKEVMILYSSLHHVYNMMV